MSNKRQLKKQINLVCNELFVDFVAATLYGKDPTEEKAEAILRSLAYLQKNYTSRICHPEPGMPAKKYFKDLRINFSKDTHEILDHIINL